MRVWSSIKKPSPQAFFENLLPYPADGFFRQAMVLCWMMMPRTGGRYTADVRKAVTGIFQRNLTGWEQDNEFFAKGKKRKAKPGTARISPAKRPSIKKKAGRKASR